MCTETQTGANWHFTDKSDRCTYQAIICHTWFGCIFNELPWHANIVNKLVSQCIYQLCHIKSCHRNLPINAAKSFVNYFAVSWVDNCNTLLVGSLRAMLNKFHPVFNTAAKVIYGCNKFDHVMRMLQNKLHWLYITERVSLLLSPTHIQSSSWTRSLIHCRLLQTSRINRLVELASFYWSPEHERCLKAKASWLSIQGPGINYLRSLAWPMTLPDLSACYTHLFSRSFASI